MKQQFIKRLAQTEGDLEDFFFFFGTIFNELFKEKNCEDIGIFKNIIFQGPKNKD